MKSLRSFISGLEFMALYLCCKKGWLIALQLGIFHLTIIQFITKTK